MVVFHIDVADDIVVHDCVFTRAVVPRLILGIVGPVLQSLQFVFEVEYVVSLFVAKSSVL